MIVLCMLEHNCSRLVCSIKNKRNITCALAHTYTSKRKKITFCLPKVCRRRRRYRMKPTAHGRDIYSKCYLHTFFGTYTDVLNNNVYILTTTTILGIGTKTFYTNDIILICFAYNSQRYARIKIRYIH